MMRELFLQNLSLWDCLWQSTVFLVLGLAAGWLLRRRPSRAYAALLFAMTVAAFVPFLSAMVRHYNLGAFPDGPQEPVQVWLHAPGTATHGIADAPPEIDVPTPTLDSAPGRSSSTTALLPWRMILLYAWLAMTLALWARLGATFLYGAHIVRHAQSLGFEEIQQVVEHTASRLQLTNGPRVRASERIGSPVVWCWTRPPVLLVPRTLNCRDVDWAGVVAHELAHYRRWDHVTGLIAEVTASLLPWNPLTWLARRSLVRLGEQACDDWVVATGQPSEDYAELLLRFRVQRQMAFWPAMVSSKTGLAHRVRRILNDACGNPQAGLRWALTLSIIATCVGVGVAFAQTRAASSEAAARQDDETAGSLHQAAKAGALEQVKEFIREGANVNTAEGDEKSTPLHAAASGGHAQVVRALLDAGANVNAGDSHGHTPLYYAIWNDGEETVGVLISGGADVNKGPAGDYPPLVYAIWQAKKSLVERVLNAGADINTKDEQGYTPLYWAAFTSVRDVLDLVLRRKDWPDTIHLAACKGELKKVTTLIGDGANVTVKDEFGCTPLHWAALADTNDVAAFLLAQGADANARDNMSFTPLMAGHRIGMVALLISQGADVNAKVATHGRTRLHMSCYAGEEDIAELLIAKGADVDARDKGGTTPLRLAAASGHKDIVELLVKAGADVNAKDNQGRTPLQRAKEQGHSEVVEFLRQHGAKESLHDIMAAGDIDRVQRLISDGADVNAKDAKDQTPLHVAVLAGRKDLVELLIANRADMNAKSNTWDTTPLIAAIKSGHEDIVRLLVAKGADVRARGRGDYTPLHCAAMNRARMAGSPEIMGLLLARGADIEARQEHDATPLACATFDGNTETTRFLIEHGANIEAALNDGETTPLLRAVSQQYVETARVLLDKGANIHATWRGLSAIDNAMLGDRLSNRKGDPKMVELLIEKGLKCPPIHLAAFSGDLQELKNLLNDGATVDEQDTAGFTPLHCAVCGDHMDIVRFLLSQGASVNAKNRNGWTPLAFVWTAEMATLLVNSGADVRIVDERGQTALHWAVNRDNHRGDKALSELLLKHGADVDARAGSTSVSWAGWTPLHVACRNGAQDIVELLLAHGANINAKTDKRETPMAVAQSNGHGQIVDLLRRHGAKE